MAMARSFSIGSGACLAGLLAFAACGGPAPEARPEAPISAAPTVSLADIERLGVPNPSMPIEHLLAAGQPTEEQMAALIQLGYTNFVSLREPGETGAGWEETRVMDMGDISFSRIPVTGAEGLTRANVEALDRVLDEAGAKNTVLYCGSGNRVGGLLALRAYWLEGATAEEALALGRDAGLRSLEPAVADLLAQPR